MNKKNDFELSVGLPVFNGEKFLKKRLDSLLQQTFTNFEIIISDNGSNDSTQQLCEEYVKKDIRIKYIRHKVNRGYIWNFNFVLNESKCKYFVWAAVDDIWKDSFLEKNISQLKNDSNVISSICKIKTIYQNNNEKGNKSEGNKLYKKIRNNYLLIKKNSLENKLKFFLKRNKGTNVYAVYRTKELKKILKNIPIIEWDLAITLNSLNYGEIYEIDEVLMYKYLGGFSSGTFYEFVKKHDLGFLKIIFPEIPFLIWFKNTFGLKIFLKNLDWFSIIFIFSEYQILSGYLKTINNND